MAKKRIDISLRVLYRSAKIAEHHVNNPGQPLHEIASLFNVHLTDVSRLLNKYYQRGGDYILVIESGIDSPKAILQEIELSFKENTSVLNIAQ